MFQPRPWKSQEDFKNHDHTQRASHSNAHGYTQLHIFLSSPSSTIRTLQDLLTDIYALKVSVETLGKEVAMLGRRV